jgi:hypothetical protein
MVVPLAGTGYLVVSAVGMTDWCGLDNAELAISAQMKIIFC